MKQPQQKKQRGPILIETKVLEFPFDLRKLPAKYRRLRTHVARDRDTGCEGEIFVEWANELLFKSSDVGEYQEIIDKIETNAFSIRSINNRLTMLFGESRKWSAKERRKCTDRRTGGDRRN